MEILAPRECQNCDKLGATECIECYGEKHPVTGQYGWFWNKTEGKYELVKLEDKHERFV